MNFLHVDEDVLQWSENRRLFLWKTTQDTDMNKILVHLRKILVNAKKAWLPSAHRCSVANLFHVLSACTNDNEDYAVKMRRIIKILSNTNISLTRKQVLRIHDAVQLLLLPFFSLFHTCVSQREKRWSDEEIMSAIGKEKICASCHVSPEKLVALLPSLTSIKQQRMCDFLSSSEQFSTVMSNAGAAMWSWRGRKLTIHVIGTWADFCTRCREEWPFDIVSFSEFKELIAAYHEQSPFIPI